MSEERESGEVEYRALVREAVRGEGFVRVTVQGARAGERVPWERVVVRPVQVKGERRLQFSYFDGRKDTTKNYDGEEAARKLDELLALPYRQFHVQTAAGALHLRITKKGKALVQREAAREEVGTDTLAHDRVKDQPLPLTRPDAFLQALGVMDAAGKIRPGMQAKYRQINEFLRLLDGALERIENRESRIRLSAGGQVESNGLASEVPLKSGAADEPLEVLDCGSGNAYLTFAAYHYLAHVLGIPARVTGVDSDPEVVARSQQRSESLGWPELGFHIGRIADFVPARPPDIVLSLHACDTATDEAIALGVKSGSQVILAAPCCQHELFEQLEAPLFQPVLRHGVLRGRMADLLTDAFRALALRIMGYRTEVVQFVSPEHTTKNLMIRAVRAGLPVPAQLVQEYRALRDFWQVRPSIETLLGEGFAVRLASGAAAS